MRSAADDVVGHDVVDRDTPPGDRDARLAGGHEHRTQAARTGGAIELEGQHLFADHRVGSHAVHDADARGAVARTARDVEVRRGQAQVAQLHTALLGGRAQFLVVAQQRVQTRLDVEPGLDRLQQHRSPGRRGEGESVVHCSATTPAPSNPREGLRDVLGHPTPHDRVRTHAVKASDLRPARRLVLGRAATSSSPATVIS
jgi:hypothetical protein